MKTHKFARKPFYVDAVRVSEENIEEVAAWCQGEVLVDDNEGAYIKVRVHRPLTDRQTMAFIGDWVLGVSTGFKVYTPKAFDKSFEKVKTLTKAQADEAGIKVPREPSVQPTPSEPRVVKDVQQFVGDVKKPFAVPEPPKSKADVEADKLINEVLNG